MKFIIKWNAGYGDSYDVVDAKDEDEALHEAYELWKEEAESNADYDVLEYTEERAEDLGVE